jgi:hypothetical protein
MLEEQLQVVENPEYTAQLKYQAEMAAANLAAQEKTYKDQCRYQCRLTALEIANRVTHPDFDKLIESAEKLYEWLVKDL